MEKIIIFGNSGSGKSTLAKKLANKSQLAHLDLDSLAWQDSEPTSRKPIEASLQEIELFLKQNQSWVIEGCYADLLRCVAEKADQAVFMNLSVSQCQQNAKKRPWEPHKYNSKAAQDANLPLLLNWIAAYTERSDEFSYQAHQALFNNFSGAKQCITENQTFEVGQQ